jgi:hypothetical protein
MKRKKSLTFRIIKMKRIIFLVWLLTVAFSSNAIELVCKGQQQRDGNQRAIMVDCTKRIEVIEYLQSAWQLLRKERIRGELEDLCWKGFQQAEDMHPSIQFNMIAVTFFAQCNMGLAYVK